MGVMAMFLKKLALRAMILGAATLVISAAALAQEYPSRPITFIVPFVPGGSASVMARIVADKMSAELGQTIIIDHHGGAGSALGARMVARSAPDGYTILLATNATLGIVPNLQLNVGYDSRKDFAPIGLIGAIPSVLVVKPDYPANTLGDLIKIGKTPGEVIDFGTPGVGTVNHLSGELLAIESGAKLRHIPYRGAAPALNDLLGGHIPLVISAIPNVHSHIGAGTLRALAVTSGKRSFLLPDVPTVAEQGFPDYDMVLTDGVAAPAGTPPDIVEKLNKALNAALATKEVKDHLAIEGTEPIPMTPQQYADEIDRDETKWSKLIKSVGIKPQ
jgi:tripartite-type tricarboxylate transporter receptor subunit TctC